MNEQSVTHYLGELAERGVSCDINLWPDIRRQAERTRRARQARRRLHHQGDEYPEMNRFSLRTSVAICILTLVLTLGVPAVTLAAPHVRSQLQRFGLTLIDHNPTAPAIATNDVSRVQMTPVAHNAQPVTPPVSAISSAARQQPWMTLAEAQRQVPFSIHVPTWLPAGLTFRGVSVDAGSPGEPTSDSITVVLSYIGVDRKSGTSLGGLHIDQTKGPRAGGYGVPATGTEDVLINGLPGVFVAGIWQQDEAGKLQWNARADSAILSWEDAGLTYVLQFSGLHLAREDLIRIAESLH